MCASAVIYRAVSTSSLVSLSLNVYPYLRYATFSFFCQFFVLFYLLSANLSLASPLVTQFLSVTCFVLLYLNSFLQFYEGLRPQDLRRLKDMLIVETADMLQAPLFTAEALLRAHGTNKHTDTIFHLHISTGFVLKVWCFKQQILILLAEIIKKKFQIFPSVAKRYIFVQSSFSYKCSK